VVPTETALGLRLDPDSAARNPSLGWRLDWGFWPPRLGLGWPSRGFSPIQNPQRFAAINGGDAEIANARLDQELFGAGAAAVDGGMSLALRTAVCAGLLSRCCVCDMHVGMGMGDTFMYEYHLLHQIVSSPNPLAHGESSSPSLADPAFGFYTSVPRRGGRGGYLGLSSRGSAPMHIVSDDEDAFRDRARLELASGAESTQTDRTDRPQLVIEHVR
jgi:hypothetical protein